MLRSSPQPRNPQVRNSCTPCGNSAPKTSLLQYLSYFLFISFYFLIILCSYAYAFILCKPFSYPNVTLVMPVTCVSPLFSVRLVSGLLLLVSLFIFPLIIQARHWCIMFTTFYAVPLLHSFFICHLFHHSY